MVSLKKFRKMPGTLEYTGDIHKDTIIKHIKYSKETMQMFDNVQAIEDYVVDWIDVQGLSSVDVVTDLCQIFDIEQLVVEDILHVNQRTKVERFDRYWFVVMRYAYLDDNVVKHDYISMLLFPHLLITFSESENRFIDLVIERINHPKSNLRKFKHDYLFYVLYDLIVDESLVVSSFVLDQIEQMENNLVHLNQHDQITLYELRKELVFLRSMTSQLLTNIPKESFSDAKFFDPKTKKYYDDVYDHLHVLRNQVVMSIEQVSHMLDVYLNQVSNRMNQIMTTLTIFSAIFIPLSFVAGVFGMNFTNFPMLANQYGMLFFILICVLIPVGMLTYFKLRKWF